MAGIPSRHLDERGLSEDSLEDPDPSGFSFILVQHYVQVVKLAVGWEETDTTSKRSKSYFSILKLQVSFFPLMDAIKEVIEE